MRQAVAVDGWRLLGVSSASGEDLGTKFPRAHETLEVPWPLREAHERLWRDDGGEVRVVCASLPTAVWVSGAEQPAQQWLRGSLALRGGLDVSALSPAVTRPQPDAVVRRAAGSGGVLVETFRMHEQAAEVCAFGCQPLLGCEAFDVAIDGQGALPETTSALVPLLALFGWGAQRPMLMSAVVLLGVMTATASALRRPRKRSYTIAGR